MAFTPKFVDMVRNFTTSQGSGPVALGAAVSGFTSFADAVLAGDQFYYAMQSVDKPQEREVGRGTMQANGTIAREPVSGTATNFSSGTKTIALVAAAEWFTKFEGGGAGGTAIDVATRAELAAKANAPGRALLTEAGREGLFVFDPANLSAKVAADPVQGIYVAPASDPSGASGAWVRRVSGEVNVRWFGAVGDNVANDGPAFSAAVAYCFANRISGFGYTQGSLGLFVPAGRYYLGTTPINLTHPLAIRGEFGGNAGGGGTCLRWAAGTSGIIVQGYGTTGESAYGTAQTTYAGGTRIEGLYLQGGFAGTEGNFHGINLRGAATIRDCAIRGFQGDGIFSATDIVALMGNANCARIDNVMVELCRNGFVADGVDSNAWCVTGLNCSQNRGWGILDSSFLGNYFFGCHTATNGDGTNQFPSRCRYNGKYYYVLRGQEAWCKANPPSGTTGNNQGWAYHGTGAAQVSWPEWDTTFVYRSAGGYCADDPVSQATFVGCYSELDQTPHQLAGGATMIGGLIGQVVSCADGTVWGGWYKGNIANQIAPRGLTIESGQLRAKGSAHLGPAYGDPPDNFLGIVGSTGGYAGWQFRNFYGTSDTYLGHILGNAPGELEFNSGPYGIKLMVAYDRIATFETGGINLAPGKAIKVNGTAVVGARGAAVADATDAASAITQLNALLARCRAHGLIAA